MPNLEPPKGWHRFQGEYRMDDGSGWVFEILAQSHEDAETRLRCIKNNGAVCGRIVAQIDNEDGDIDTYRKPNHG